MIEEILRRTVLSRRVLREDPFEEITWPDEYFQSWTDGLGINGTGLAFFNTYNRQCQNLLIRDERIILIDNYYLELFLIFNQMLEGGFDEKQIMLLFLKLTKEKYIISYKEKQASCFEYYESKLFSQCDRVVIRQVTKDTEPRYIYVQQAFLIAHELMHSLFQQSPDTLCEHVGIMDDLLKKIFPRIDSHSFTDSDKEEFCCDHIAVYLTMDASINTYGNSVENSAAAILLALCHQLTIFLIDRWVQDELQTKYIEANNYRTTIVRTYICNYVKQKHKESLESVKHRLDEVYGQWKRIVFKSLIDYFDTFNPVKRQRKENGRGQSFISEQLP